MTRLGWRCVADLDCDEGSFCLTSIDGGSDSFPGGICTISCDLGLDLDCAAAKPGSRCVTMGVSGSYCLEGCTLGADVGCSERTDSFCIDLAAPGSSPAPTCVAFCSNDQQCRSGVCNHETGLCSATADPGTLPLGAPCVAALPNDPSPPPDGCADGFCTALVEGGSDGICTALCRGDVLPQCGWSGPAETISGLCLQPAAAGLLDLGLCRRPCDCDDDCINPAMRCYAEPQLAQFGAFGYCVMVDGLPGIACQ